MANRYPLVVDTSDNNQIKEIPNGDNLLLTGNSITGVVDITASGNISAAGVVMSGTLTYQGNPLANIATTAAYSDLTGVPTNVSQFTNDANYRSNGDNVSVFTNDAGYLTTVAFNDLTGKPTTLGGYGIIDAASSVQGSLATSALQPGANISTLNNDSGFVTLTQLTDGTVTVDVNNSGDLVGSVFADDSTVMIDSMLGAVNLDGTIRGNVVPNANQHNTWDLGTDAVRFKNAYFAGTINGAHVGTLDGDVEGSVFGDDSTLLVDGNNNKIVGAVDTASLTVSSTNVAIGNSAGLTGQNGFAVAIGTSAGLTNQSTKAVAVGDSAGSATQGEYSVAVGNLAGQTTQGANAVAVGRSAGVQVQGASAVAIGYEAGSTTQGSGGIALGSQSGQSDQGSGGIAIGYQSGQSDQGASATAIGYGAGGDMQGESAIALGSGAGNTYQGAKAIAIGYNAGNSGQAANSIVINASSTTLENPTASSLRIKPIRSAVGTTMLMYDASSGEVTHTASPVITGDITGSVFGDDSTLLVDGVNGTLNATTLTGALPAIDGSALTGVTTAFSNITSKPTTLAGYGITDAANTSAETTFTADVKFDTGVEEKFATLTGSTGVTTMDCANGHIHYLTTPAGDITANFTNLGLTAEYATNLTVIINQGATPYEVTAVQIGGAAQTIEWQGGLAPTGNANGIDSFSFTILNDGGSFVVLGQMVDFT
jgi:hypothetical protein